MWLTILSMQTKNSLEATVFWGIVVLGVASSALLGLILVWCVLEIVGRM